MGRFNCQENIEEIQEYTYLYKDYGNLSNEMLDLEIDDGQFEKILKLIKTEGLSDDWEDALENRADDNKEDVAIDFMYETLLPHKFYDSQIIEKIDYLKQNDISSTWDAYEYVYTSGYSQGDGRYTLINMQEGEKVWGNKPSLDNLREEISHYIYDQPMCLRLTVEENEYFSEKDGWYDEYINYDKDTIQKEFFEQVKADYPELDDEIINETLNDILPSELKQDYETSSQNSTVRIQEAKSEEVASLKDLDVSEENQNNTNSQR